MSIEHSDCGWRWTEAGKAVWRMEGARLHVAVPRAMLGLSPGAPIDLRFKWADNMQSEGDVMDFTLYGDAAPPGRFAYRYQADTTQ